MLPQSIRQCDCLPKAIDGGLGIKMLSATLEAARNLD
jgi:hypothetical protein